MKLTTLLVGRVLFMVPFLMIGLHHFMMADQMATMIPSWMPGSLVMVYVSGLCFIAGAVAVITGIQTRLASILLAVLLLIVVALIQFPAMMSVDSNMSSLGLLGVMKDTGLAGGALILSHVYTKKKLP